MLLGLGCATTAGNGEVVPTNAGVLFFGQDPQQFVLQSEVVCVLFRDELGVGTYIDRKIVRGTMQDLIDGAEAFLNKYVAVGAQIVGWKRIDLPEYPVEALREAIVNAVIHRDYGRVGESIRVFYFPDRVEIHSPGALLPGITVEQMEQGKVQSKLRNPVLAGLLRDVPGYMERMGSGIRLMLNETKRMGLPAPQFREMGEFIVTFRKTPSDISPPTSATLEEDKPQQLALDVLHETIPLLSSSKTILADVDKRRAVGMRYVQEHGSITNREYRELTGVSEQTGNRDLEALVEQGALVKVGTKRGRRYKLP
jgi:ATP-dependent DNA helicase RecG